MDLDKEITWQEAPNSTWYTNRKPKCEVCRKYCDAALQLKVDEDSESITVCFFGNTDCMRKVVTLCFSEHKDLDFMLARMLIYKPLVVNSMKSDKKREPVGLSKRYNVLNRDGFQCVLCGDSGKDAKLEIDHIIPVSNGGTSSVDNLRTLCFKCNRGKSNKEEGINNG